MSSTFTNLQQGYSNTIREFPLASGATVPTEGTVLVTKIEDGQKVVQLSSGATGELFAGFARVNYGTPSVKVEVYTATIPAVADAAGEYHIQLPHANIVSASVRIATTAAPQTAWTHVANAAAVNATTKYYTTILTGDVEFHADDAGTEVVITYKRSLSVLDTEQIFWRSSVNRSAVEHLSSISVMEGPGVVWTSHFDSAQSYEDGTGNPVPVYGGANGLVTSVADVDADATDSHIIGYVQHVPTQDEPWLGVQFVAPQA